jgi:hypothetical protein
LKAKSNQTSDPDQRDRFIEAACELGADDGQATFKAKLAADRAAEAEGWAGVRQISSD